MVLGRGWGTGGTSIRRAVGRVLSDCSLRNPNQTVPSKSCALVAFTIREIWQEVFCTAPICHPQVAAKNGEAGRHQDMEGVLLPDTFPEQRSPLLLARCHPGGHETGTVQRALQFHQVLSGGASWMDEPFLPGPHHSVEAGVGRRMWRMVLPWQHFLPALSSLVC